MKKNAAMCAQNLSTVPLIKRSSVNIASARVAKIVGSDISKLWICLDVQRKKHVQQSLQGDI
jgi:hypothetical protein